MAIPILVTGRQRSGTTVYRNLLAANGAFDCGEIFHAEFKNNKLNFYWNVYQQVQEDPLLLHPIRHTAMFKDFLKNRIASVSAANALIDVKHNALRLVDGGITERTPSVIRLCAEAGGKFLHILRENKLRVIASLAIAEATQVWRNTGERDLPFEQRKVRLPPNLTFETVVHDTLMEQQVSAWLADVPTETIRYEGMFDPDGAFSDEAFAVAERLLGRPIPRESGGKVALKKQNPEPLSEIVVNYAELHRRFRGTRFEWMLAG